MPARVLRAALASLAVAAAATGVPATFAPRWFYDSFPAGLGWVENLPPYNSHLATDTGGFYLAFAVLFAWCAVSLRRALVVPVTLAWMLAQAAHFAYHAFHLDRYGTGDAVAQTLSLAALLILPAIVLATRDAAR